jgi:putative spermidine/putrescine transport system substrate-binding protein
MARIDWKVAVAVSASMLLLASCSTGSGTTSSAASQGDSGQITLSSWGGVYSAAQQTAMVDPFQAANPNVKVNVTGGNDQYAKIKLMVDSGNVEYDVVDADPYFPIGNCGTYAEKIDTTVVDTSKMNPALVSDCAVPAIQFDFVLVYNKVKYAAHPPKDWADFFDTKNFPGKRAIQNSALGGGYEIALLADGVAPDKIYPIDYNRAFKKLNTLKANISFWGSGAQSQQMLESGAVDMMLAWNGRAYNAVKNGAHFAPNWNQHLIAYNAYFVPKGAKNKDLAMKFIAFATSAKPQSVFQSLIPYPAIVSDAPESTGDALFKSFLPGGDTTGVVLDQAWWATNMAEATAKWTAWAAG